MLMLMVAMIATAKDIKTVIFTTTPQMHCANCEAKVKNNLRFAKGVKEIKTSVEEQKQRRLKSLFMRTRSAIICKGLNTQILNCDSLKPII